MCDATQLARNHSRSKVLKPPYPPLQFPAVLHACPCPTGPALRLSFCTVLPLHRANCNLRGGVYNRERIECPLQGTCPIFLWVVNLAKQTNRNRRYSSWIFHVLSFEEPELQHQDISGASVTCAKNSGALSISSHLQYLEANPALPNRVFGRGTARQC